MRTHRIQVKRINGFTLVELLTVVAIIGLLVSMVVPTVKAVLENKARMELAVLIRALEDGCNTYKMSATGNKYYPGQDAEGSSVLGGTASVNYPNCQNAGSALLARYLFTKIDPNDPTVKQFPVSNYGTLGRGMLGTIEGIPNSIVDKASEIMAILYYPSRLAGKGLVTQYVIADNSKYTAPAGVTDPPTAKNSNGTMINIQTHVQAVAGTTTTIVRQDGLFVITAAGKDRLYFSGSAVNNLNK